MGFPNNVCVRNILIEEIRGQFIMEYTGHVYLYMHRKYFTIPLDFFNNILLEDQNLWTSQSSH